MSYSQILKPSSLLLAVLALSGTALLCSTSFAKEEEDAAQAAHVLNEEEHAHHAPRATLEQAKQHQMHSSTKSADELSKLPAWQQEYVKMMDTMHEGMMHSMHAPDADSAFVLGMIPHHQGAIDMAKLELQHGKDASLLQLAQNIIDAQTFEIELMQKYLESAGIDASKLEQKTSFDDEWEEAYNLTMTPMHTEMDKALEYSDADMGFVVGMIPHHQGAIDMARFVIQYGQNENIKNLARAIIEAQETEIDFMKNYASNHK